jgi:hypothetical protein
VRAGQRDHGRSREGRATALAEPRWDCTSRLPGPQVMQTATLGPARRINATSAADTGDMPGRSAFFMTGRGTGPATGDARRAHRPMALFSETKTKV